MYVFCLNFIIIKIIFGRQNVYKINRNSMEYWIKVSIGIWNGFRSICDHFDKYMEDHDSSKIKLLIFSTLLSNIFLF